MGLIVGENFGYIQFINELDFKSSRLDLWEVNGWELKIGYEVKDKTKKIVAPRWGMASAKVFDLWIQTVFSRSFSLIFENKNNRVNEETAKS